ncbi:MAG: hypothetical protein IV107_13385 [Paucibacter sp.]|nr:hypothetical protein [Roseateles sp.]
MRKIFSSIIKATLFSIVALYVIFPNEIDSKYGTLVVVVVIFLVALMAFDGIKAARKIKNREN